MFHVYPHFANTPADAHPGQPVHSEKDFDVFRDAGDGQLFVIPEGGEPLKFPADKLEAVKTFVRDHLKTRPPLTHEQLLDRLKNGPPLHPRYQPPAPAAGGE